MRAAVLGVLVCVMTVATAWAQTATLTHNTNLRQTASTAKPPIEELPAGVSVTLVTTTKRNGYFHVTAPDGKEGWVWSPNVALGAGGATPPTLALADPDTIETGKYAMHSSCQPWGDGDPAADDGLRNKAKRWMAGGNATALTIANLVALQGDTDPDAATGKKKTRGELTLTDRHAGLIVVSEGDRVAVSGFLNHADWGSAAESVNCKTSKSSAEDGRDVHVNIGPEPNGDEYAGIVAELIPQLPVGDWSVPAAAKARTALQGVMAKKLRVLAIGSLTYDNEHSLKHVSGQPKRAALWEVHPILAFYVCETEPCDPTTTTGWTALTDYAKH